MGLLCLAAVVVAKRGEESQRREFLSLSLYLYSLHAVRRAGKPEGVLRCAYCGGAITRCLLPVREQASQETIELSLEQDLPGMIPGVDSIQPPLEQ